MINQGGSSRSISRPASVSKSPMSKIKSLRISSSSKELVHCVNSLSDQVGGMSGEKVGLSSSLILKPVLRGVSFPMSQSLSLSSFTSSMRKEMRLSSIRWDSKGGFFGLPECSKNLLYWNLAIRGGRKRRRRKKD